MRPTLDAASPLATRAARAVLAAALAVGVAGAASSASNTTSAQPGSTVPAGATAIVTAAAVLRFTTIAAPDGVPLNVVEGGVPNGPPVLLVHGYSQAALSWLPQFEDPGLARRYRLVALDLRGHGASGKPWAPQAYAGSRPWADDLHAVVECLGLVRPVVVGWSFGGYVALDYLRERGADAVSGIVLVGSHGGLLPRPEATPAPQPTDLRVQLANAHRFMDLMSAHPLRAETRDLGVAAALMLPAYAREAMGAKRLDNRDLVEPLARVRTLAILGAADPSVPAAPLAELLATRGGRAVVYEGVGHSPFAEASARFGADLAEFVEAAHAGDGARAGAPAGPPGRAAPAPWVRAVEVPDAVRAYVDGVNAGDAARAVAAFADDGTMYLTEGRVARGHAALREVERFHEALRPHIAPEGLSARRYGDRIVVAMRTNAERSPLFEAMGLPQVRTAGVGDAFVVEHGRLTSARQPEFPPPCRRVMASAMGEARRWLETTSDPRLATLAPGGRVRMDPDTAPAWLAALRDWRAATGWAPEAGDRDACANGAAR